MSFNRWNYVNGNPINYADPSGHCIDGVSTAVCFMILAGIAAGVALVVTDQYNGNSPDILGIGYAVNYGPDPDNSALTTYTAAGLAVQGNWEPLSSLPRNLWSSGLGHAQVSINQLNGTDPNKGELNIPVGSNIFAPFYPSIANQAMEKRIYQVLSMCNKGGKITCSETDLFLGASQSQNSGFFMGNMRDLVNSKNALGFDPNNSTQALLPWGDWFDNPIRARNDPAAAIYDRFMVKLFSNDVKELGCLGWYVPPDIDWDYINSWTTGAYRSK